MGKCCCVLFLALLTWSRGTSIQEFTFAAPVSSRTEIVYVRGQLCELAVPLRAMTVSPGRGPSAAAAPLTLNWAASTVTGHVTAADRPPEHLVGGATYTRQRLFQLRDLTAERWSAPGGGFLTRLRRLGIMRGVGRRGVRGGRKSRRPIPVRVTSRPFTVRTGCAGVGRRHLLCPPRLTLRQTRRDGAGAAAGPSRALKLGHLNVRSLTAHMDEVNLLLLREQLDVLCLSESWLTKAVDSSALLFPGYSVSRRDRKSKAGGGVAIIHRNTLKTEPLRVPANDSTLETLWLQITGRSTVVIGVMYRPPSGPYVPAIESLHHQLTTVLARGRPIYLMGDSNIDLLHPTKPGVASYLQHLSDLSLSQLITEPTRPGTTPSLIDHLVTSRPDLTSSPRVTPCNISDHDLISVFITDVKTRHQPETVTLRSTRHVDNSALCLDLLLADWSPLDGADSTSSMWNSFLTAWNPIINKHMPMRTIKLRHRPGPWLEDDAVRDAMAARDQARIDRDLTPCDVTDREFRESRNAVKMAINRASTAYYASAFKHSRPKTWKSVRQFLIQSPKSQSIAAGAAPEDPGWSDRLNRFFTSVGSDVATALARSDTGELLTPRPPRVCAGAFSPGPATLPELSAALSRMSSSRACGPDGITVHMLRCTFPVIGPHLLKIVNHSIVNCDVPAEWKSAVVTALHKKGDTSDPNNYRPISVISVVAKLCERVVCTQLVDYLVSHHVLCHQQYGFRPGQSTEAALLDAVTYATDNIDRGMMTSLVTADTSKAFDSVEHGRLLDKLEWYGVHRDWFSAWLRGRTQTVRGGSCALEVTHGVIQGSIMGPVLFLLYANDLPQHIPYGKVVMYADDTQFLDAEIPSNLHVLKTRVESSLSAALTWFTQNRLKINATKTEMIILRSRRQVSKADMSVQFGNDVIFPTESVKVLGVVIDQHLTWTSHITLIVKRCYCVLLCLARNRHKLPKCVRRLLVESLVFPHIRYCITVWGSCTAAQRRRVQKAINFGVRIVNGLSMRDHVTPSLLELGWPSIDEIITERDLATVRHLITSHHAPLLLSSLLVRRSAVSSRRTRATEGGQLELPRARTEFAKRSFLYRGAKTWNAVTQNAVTAP